MKKILTILTILLLSQVCFAWPPAVPPNTEALSADIGDYSNNIATAIATIGSTETTLIINAPTAGNATIPTNIQLWFIAGGELTGTVAFAGSPDSQIIALPGQQIFSSTATVTFGVGGTDYPEWWGDIADDTVAIRSAINAFSTCASGVVVFTNKSVAYYITETISVPIHVNLKGLVPHVKIVMDTGTYATGYGFLWNTTNGSDFVTAYPYGTYGKIENIEFYANVSSYKGIMLNGSVEIYRCLFTGFEQAIYAGTTYNDQIKISRCTFINNIATTAYQIEFGNLGDAGIIEQCHFPNRNNSPSTPMKSIKITGGSFNIKSCLLGDIYIDTGRGLSTISDTGADGGQWIFDKTNVTVRSCSLSARESDTAIKLVDYSTAHNYHINLEDIQISHDIQRDLYHPYAYDIKIAGHYVVIIKDVSKNIIRSGDVYARQLFGIKIEKEAGTSFTDFNDLSAYYSKNCIINNETIENISINQELAGGAIFAFNSLAAYSSVVWDEASDTYYYRMQIIYEPNRIVSVNDSYAERSLALTNAGSGAVLGLTAGRGALLKVYRGTSTGSYDKYAYIPIYAADSLIDDGNYISGIAWESRSAGVMDDINAFNLTGFSVDMGKVILRATEKPTVGTWELEDMIYNSALAVDGNNMISYGWICTTAGTPGTWSPMYISTVTPAN